MCCTGNAFNHISFSQDHFNIDHYLQRETHFHEAHFALAVHAAQPHPIIIAMSEQFFMQNHSNVECNQM